MSVGVDGVKRWIRRRRNQDAAGAVANSDAWEARVRSEHVARKARVGPYRDLADEILALLSRHDPIGINVEDNTDEYDPEAETIVLRLVDAGTILSADEIKVLVHEEFVRWFGDGIAGPVERYRRIAQEIRELWRPALPAGGDG